MSHRAYRVRLTRAARAQVTAIREWWSRERPLAPQVFAVEFERCMALLESFPRLGARYELAALPDLRRILLRHSKQYVYYTIAEADQRVTVRAVWHAARGSPPEVREGRRAVAWGA